LLFWFLKNLLFCLSSCCPLPTFVVMVEELEACIMDYWKLLFIMCWLTSVILYFGMSCASLRLPIDFYELLLWLQYASWCNSLPEKYPLALPSYTFLWLLPEDELPRLFSWSTPFIW
jgi:hypothetical protein